MEELLALQAELAGSEGLPRSELLAAREELTASLAALEARLAVVSAEAEARVAEAEADTAMAVAKMSATRAAHESDMFEAEERALAAERDVRERLEGSETLATEAQSMLQNVRAEAQALEKTLEESRAELRTALETIASLEERCAALSAGRAEDRAKASRLASSLAQRAEEEATRAARSEAALAEARAAVDRAGERAANARSAAMRDARRERDAIFAREREQKARADKAERELVHAKAALAESREKGEAASRDLRDTNDALAHTQSLLSASEAKLKSANESNAGQREALGRVRRQLSEMEAATKSNASQREKSRAIAARAEYVASHFARDATNEALCWKSALEAAVEEMAKMDQALREAECLRTQEGKEAADLVRAALGMASVARREVAELHESMGQYCIRVEQVSSELRASEAVRVVLEGGHATASAREAARFEAAQMHVSAAQAKQTSQAASRHARRRKRLLEEGMELGTRSFERDQEEAAAVVSIIGAARALFRGDPIAFAPA